MTTCCLFSKEVWRFAHSPCGNHQDFDKSCVQVRPACHAVRSRHRVPGPRHRAELHVRARRPAVSSAALPGPSGTDRAWVIEGAYASSFVLFANKRRDLPDARSLLLLCVPAYRKRLRNRRVSIASGALQRLTDGHERAVSRHLAAAAGAVWPVLSDGIRQVQAAGSSQRSPDSSFPTGPHGSSPTSPNDSFPKSPKCSSSMSPNGSFPRSANSSSPTSPNGSSPTSPPAWQDGSSEDLSASFVLSRATELDLLNSAEAKYPTEAKDPAAAKNSSEPPSELLNLWEVHRGRRQRFAWDGRSLRSLELSEEATNGGLGWRNLLLKSVRVTERAAKDAFFPEKVTEDYWLHMRWRFGQRVLSSFIHTYGTQSLLRAVGVGGRDNIQGAAALNWVLKDGLGRLGKLTYAAGFGRKFDADLKRIRFLTSVIFTMSLFLEILTPFFPHLFLLLATLANVGKSVGLTTHLATSPSIHKSFALSENLADISAKSQAQAVVADNLGLAFAVGLAAACSKNPRLAASLPLLTFPLLAVLDLVCIWMALKAVHLRTLNKERLEIITEHWLRTGRVLSAKEVSDREGLMAPGQIGSIPVRILSISSSACSPAELAALLRRHSPDRFVVNLRHRGPAALQPLRDIPLLRPLLNPKPEVVVSLREDARAVDIITSILQAAHVCSLLSLESGSDVCGPESMIQSDGSDSEEGDWDELACSRWLDLALTRSRELAHRDRHGFIEAMSERGWQTRHVMLSSNERATYSLVDEPDDGLLTSCQQQT